MHGRLRRLDAPERSSDWTAADLRDRRVPVRQSPSAPLCSLQQLKSATELLSSVFGDGATNIGGFHEGLNLAAVWNLPTVFICENNLYGEYSPIATTTAVTDIAERAASYNMAERNRRRPRRRRGLCRPPSHRAVERARSGWWAHAD